MRVGDYVRTKKRCFQFPQIAKIESMKKDSGYKNQYFIVLDHNLIPDYEYQIYEEDVDKSSSNIMDLIKAGDYVNGMEVMEADWINSEGEYEEGLAFPMYSSDDLEVIENWQPLKYVKIKSIVTKEQFSSMEYKL